MKLRTGLLLGVLLVLTAPNSADAKAKIIKRGTTGCRTVADVSDADVLLRNMDMDGYRNLLSSGRCNVFSALHDPVVLERVQRGDEAFLRVRSSARGESTDTWFLESAIGGSFPEVPTRSLDGYETEAP